MVSKWLVELCQRDESITSLARNQTKDCSHLRRQLLSKRQYRKGTDSKASATSSGSSLSSKSSSSFSSSLNSHDSSFNEAEAEEEKLDILAQCGSFTDSPSDLFLKILGDVLQTLEKHPLDGMCSPSLIATTGVMPLSIVSVIPDIIRHHADLIVTAKRDVFLATNFWQASASQAIIVSALVELSQRAGQRGQRVVVKIMYDRGTMHQLIDNHHIVSESNYTGNAVKLPSADQIPNIDLEVMNYHKPALGTFHSKFLVVDGRVALISSNNIQDRVNLEMMTHLEGNIVKSFTDTALLSWHEVMEPLMPSVSAPDAGCPAQSGFLFGNEHPLIKQKNIPFLKHTSPMHDSGSTQEGLDESRVSDVHPSVEDRRLLNEVAELTIESDQVPEALEVEVESMHQLERETTVHPSSHSISNFTEQKQSVPAEGASVEDALRTQESLGDGSSLAAITKHLNTTLQPKTVSSLPAEYTPETTYQPFVVHKSHEPFPIAMVNRTPNGSLNWDDCENPQDAAWLAAMKYAQASVFIQSPTLNAAPIVQAILDTVRRGIVVTLYLCLGFNDAAEILPKQGGTNAQVVVRLFAALAPEHKDDLRVHWYVGKDMNQPIPASQKKRNCHIKLMVVDGHIGIQGNGNQDTQSWMHSQETNILIDSHQICSEWMTAIDSNQNTKQYGRVDNDGIWRENGKPLKDAGILDPETGFRSAVSGIAGAIKRLRGSPAKK